MCWWAAAPGADQVRCCGSCKASRWLTRHSGFAGRLAGAQAGVLDALTAPDRRRRGGRRAETRASPGRRDGMRRCGRAARTWRGPEQADALTQPDTRDIRQEGSAEVGDNEESGTRGALRDYLLSQIRCPRAFRAMLPVYPPGWLHCGLCKGGELGRIRQRSKTFVLGSRHATSCK